MVKNDFSTGHGLAPIWTVCTRQSPLDRMGQPGCIGGRCSGCKAGASVVGLFEGGGDRQAMRSRTQAAPLHRPCGWRGWCWCARVTGCPLAWPQRRAAGAVDRHGRRLLGAYQVGTVAVEVVGFTSSHPAQVGGTREFPSRRFRQRARHSGARCGRVLQRGGVAHQITNSGPGRAGLHQVQPLAPLEAADGPAAGACAAWVGGRPGQADRLATALQAMRSRAQAAPLHRPCGWRGWCWCARVTGCPMAWPQRRAAGALGCTGPGWWLTRWGRYLGQWAGEGVGQKQGKGMYLYE